MYKSVGLKQEAN